MNVTKCTTDKTNLEVMISAKKQEIATLNEMLENSKHDLAKLQKQYERVLSGK